MSKKQNTRRSIPDSVHRIYAAGMFVTAGFIVGFDNEKSGMADAMVELIEEAAIPVCMVGLLYALPNTQLTRRLTKEGRLHPPPEFASSRADQCTLGLNYDTLRPREGNSARLPQYSREGLRAGSLCRTTATTGKAARQFQPQAPDQGRPIPTPVPAARKCQADHHQPAGAARESSGRS